MMKLRFTKMHGLGNDFVVIDNMDGRILLSLDQVVFLCDRHMGVGADGVILVESSESADCFMNYRNSDGSVGLCGNGTRCTAKFVMDKLSKDKKNLSINTCSGVKKVKCIDGESFSVNMGKPSFSSPDFPKNPKNLLELEGLSLNFVSVGNPHAVAIVDDVDVYDLQILGPKIENNKNFPNRINLELVQEISPTRYKVKVWERGSGETLACGTGACASYAILRKMKKADKEITIQLPSGELYFSENDEGEIMMRGPTEYVYTGEIELK